MLTPAPHLVYPFSPLTPQSINPLQVLTLRDNYRSSSTILAAARAVLGPQSRRLRPMLPHGPALRLHSVLGPTEEGELVARQIRRLQARHGVPLSEVAVLVRTHAQTRAIEEALVSSEGKGKCPGSICSLFLLGGKDGLCGNGWED